MPVKAGQVSWRNTRVVKRLNEKPACHRREHSTVAPSPVRDPDRFLQVGQLPGSPQPACKFVVFKDRPAYEPPERFKDGTAAKNPGIAVENPAPPPPAVDASERCRRPILSLIPDIEVAADDLWISHDLADHAQRRRTDVGIGMKKQQNVARRTLSSGIHLHRSSRSDVDNSSMA